MATSATSRGERPSRDGVDPLVSRTDSDAPEQFSLLDSDYTREILVALASGPRPGRELAAACDASRPTVYRRVNRLEDVGLITSETVVGPNGNRRKRFRLVRDSLTVRIADGTIEVVVGSSDCTDRAE